MDFGSIAGAGIGGLLGGMDANSGPSGYTTSSRSEDIPDWLKPFVSNGLNAGTDLFNNLKAKPNPLLGMSEDELGNVISGKYLSPDSNPYLEATGKILSDRIRASVTSPFEGAGRYGSGAFQDLLGKNVGDALTQLYGNNYQTERQRQYGATMGAPAFVSSEIGAQFSPIMDLMKLIPNLKNTTAVDPYFKNQGAGILGGALAGSQLARMFGGGGNTAGNTATTGFDNATADYRSMGGSAGFGSFG